MNAERVIYRTWPNGTVTALFPDQHDGRYVTSYERVGQHGQADYFFVIGKTCVALPHEYADLHRELTEVVGYTLRVVVRARPRRPTVGVAP